MDLSSGGGSTSGRVDWEVSMEVVRWKESEKTREPQGCIGHDKVSEVGVGAVWEGGSGRV